MRMKRRAIAMSVTVLLALLPMLTGLAAPLDLTEDLKGSVRIELTDQAQYIYSYAYPQVDPADSSAELINTFYQTIARDAEEFEIPMNADYYLFRDFGIVIYDRELKRFNTGTYLNPYLKYNCIDSLFINSEGDFLYKTILEENTEESIKQFAADNDILFSLAFGPVLVKDGQAQTCDWYPLGEIDVGYSRAGIGQVGKLHYLWMSVNHGDVSGSWTINEFAQHFAEKNVDSAYCLDGGQTGEVVFQGAPYNHVDFGAERTVSDIIYFVSAIPEGERSAG